MGNLALKARPAPTIAAPTLADAPTLDRYPGAKLATSHVCRLARHLVAEVLGCDPLMLVGKARGPRKLAVARQFAIHLAHVVAGRSHENVAKCFSRNRSTASHHFEVVEDLRDETWFDGFMLLIEERFRLLLELAEQDPKGAWRKALHALDAAVEDGGLEGDAHRGAEYLVETFRERA